MPTMFSRLAVLAIVALAVTGCQTAEEMRAADENRCVSYGFRPRTDAFAECLQRIDLDRRAEARADSIRTSQLMWQPPVIVERRVIVQKRP